MAYVDPEIRVKEGSLIVEIWASWRDPDAPKKRIASLTVPYVLRDTEDSFEDVRISIWTKRQQDDIDCYGLAGPPVAIGQLMKGAAASSD